MTFPLPYFLVGMAVGFWAAGMTGAQEYPVRPYVDPAQLDVPWPKHSHYKQPWRAFLETRRGSDFLQGIGINYNVPGKDELAVRLLAEMGVKTVRIEVGWGHVNWEETQLHNAGRFLELLRLCRRHGLRPTILLNAHHGVPCPVRFFQRTLAADAPRGARSVRLDRLDDIVPRRTGLSNLTDYRAAEVFLTAIDPDTGECSLSQPLPRALKSGDQVLLATLKYLPAYPVGTPEFEEMAQGWERYTQLVLDVVREAGLEEFDVEIWNELSFGSAFLGTWGINHYYDPPIVQFKDDFLRPGGHAWEVGRRTVERVKQAFPRARCIWGFSNTTFFHTPIEELPPRTDGQSYHPYGTGTRKLPDQEQAPNEPWRCLEGWIPRMEIRMPEGWAQTFLQTESLMRLLHPEARRRCPPGTARFYHYLTEHGVVPPECGIHEVPLAWELKAKTALRAFCLWLHKGIDVLHYYCAYDENPLGMGLLPPNVSELPADAAFEAVATLPMKAVRHLTQALAGSLPLPQTAPLEVDVVALGQQQPVFGGEGEHPPLWPRELLAVLPFQVHEQRFVIAVYEMTYDITRPPPGNRYRLSFQGLPGSPTTVQLYDPLSDQNRPLLGVQRQRGSLTVELAVGDYPALLVVDLA
jgi:hypothetical protein